MGPRGQTDWFKVQNKTDDQNVTEVFIFDEIGYWGVSAQRFVNTLKDISTPQIDVHMNTPGGDIFDGIAIHNALVLHDAHVKVYVDSIAASAGSFIAQAGDERIMVQFSQMMIHDGIGFAIGNEADMLEMAQLLSRQSDNIAAIYANRAGGAQDAWRALMRSETWFTAEETVEAGLADRVLERKTEDGDVEDLMKQYDLAMYNYHGREEAPDPAIERLRMTVIGEQGPEQIVLPRPKNTVIGSTTLPVGDRGRTWSGDAATRRMLESGAATARRGHLYLDPDGDAETAAAYKLPFADMIDGTLTMIPSGVTAAAGGRGVNAANIPEAEKATIRNKICTMYGRIQAKYDDFPDCPFKAGDSEDKLLAGNPPKPAAQEEEPPDEEEESTTPDEEEKEGEEEDEDFDPEMVRDALARGAEDPGLPAWGAEAFKEVMTSVTTNAPATQDRSEATSYDLGLASKEEQKHEATLGDLFREAVTGVADNAPAPTEPEPEEDEPEQPAEAPPVQQDQEEVTLAELFASAVEHAASSAPAPTEAEPEEKDDDDDGPDFSGFADIIRKVAR
jgi:ATP-dependent protease ClpP protease subunit